MVRIFINGFGNIGRRLASALSADKEFQFVGIAKYTPDEGMKEALDQNFSIFVPENNIEAFKGCSIYCRQIFEVSGHEPCNICTVGI